MLWKQNTCQKCLDNRLDLSIDWSSLDCHQLSSDPSSIISFLSLFLHRLNISLKCWPLRISPKCIWIYWARDSGSSRCRLEVQKTLRRVHLTNLQSRFFSPLGIQASGNLNISLHQVWLQEQRLQGYANYIWRFCTIGQACVLHCTIYLILRGRQYILCWESATADNLLASSRVNPSLLTLSESVKALIVIIIIVMVNDHWS